MGSLFVCQICLPVAILEFFLLDTYQVGDEKSAEEGDDNQGCMIDSSCP